MLMHQLSGAKAHACTRLHLGADDAIEFRHRVLAAQQECVKHRTEVEAQAAGLAQVAAVPADAVRYWTLKCLPAGAPPVSLPCKCVELNISELTEASESAARLVVAAALQSVHREQRMPHAKVRVGALANHLVACTACGWVADVMCSLTCITEMVPLCRTSGA